MDSGRQNYLTLLLRTCLCLWHSQAASFPLSDMRSWQKQEIDKHYIVWSLLERPDEDFERSNHYLCTFLRKKLDLQGIQSHLAKKHPPRIFNILLDLTIRQSASHVAKWDEAYLDQENHRFPAVEKPMVIGEG